MAGEVVIWIVVTCTAGWLINNWIRARHGYPLEDEWGGKTPHPSSLPQQEKLIAENADLRERLAHTEDRLKVLERIVTDKSYSLGSQIEALRDATGEGHAR